MVGIVSGGTYLPLWRLDFKALEEGGKGEKTLAGFDEDVLTMGVAAGSNCLGSIAPDTIDGLFFATTTSPFKEKQISVIAAMALNLREDVMTADFGSSLRAGTNALKAAMDTVAAGSAKQILVIAADTRVGMPGSAFETMFGDGAVAFIVGSENVKAKFVISHSIIDEMFDVWRLEDDKYVRTWEERFILDEGYLKVLPAAVSALYKKAQIDPKTIAKAAYYAPEGRSHKGMVKSLKLEPPQVQDPYFGQIGDTGSAQALLTFAGALEEAKPGDKMLLASFGGGVDAMIFEATGKVENKRTLKTMLASKRVVSDYKKYLSWRGLLQITSGRRRPPLPTPSASALWRERDKNLRLFASKCNHCGYIQFPPQRVCYNCQTKDNFSNYRIAGHKATLYTYSLDYVTPSGNQPVVNSVIDFEGGGRMFVQMTDHEVSQLKVGIPLDLNFRKLYTSEGIPNYFWKASPQRFQ